MDPLIKSESHRSQKFPIRASEMKECHSSLLLIVLECELIKSNRAKCKQRTTRRPVLEKKCVHAVSCRSAMSNCDIAKVERKNVYNEKNNTSRLLSIKRTMKQPYSGSKA